MKFTKEDAYKELVARMTAKGEKLSLSDISINRTLDTLMPLINEETELADFLDNYLPLFNVANANVRNDVSVRIKEYLDKNPKDKTDNANPSPNDILMKRLAELEKTVAETKKENIKREKKSVLVSKLKEKGVKDVNWIESLLEEIPIDEDFDVDAKVSNYLNIYNMLKAQIDNNVTPGEPGGGNGKENKLKERIAKAAAFAKSQNLIS